MQHRHRSGTDVRYQVDKVSPVIGLWEGHFVRRYPNLCQRVSIEVRDRDFFEGWDWYLNGFDFLVRPEF